MVNKIIKLEVLKMKEKDQKIFDFIDKCYNGTTPQVLSTIFIRLFLEMDIITSAEANRFLTYDIAKFNEFVKHIEDSINE